MIESAVIAVSARTPIQVWPRIRHRGRPGYSGRHFDAVSPAADTPLSVALTIHERDYRKVIADETERRLAAGEQPESVMAWQSEQFTAAKATERLAKVDGSFDEVVRLLESTTQYPAIKALVRQAKREAKRSA